MYKLIIFIALLPLFGPYGRPPAQSKPSSTKTVDTYLSRLPIDLKLREDQPQKYRIICDYLYLDTLANLTNKDRVSGEYVRALPGGKARWNNVSIAQAKGFDDPFPAGTSQKYMEGFTYALTNREDMLKPEFFPGFPAAEMKTKNLVWDMHMVEEFSWDYFDKLELNKTYAIQSAPQDVPLAGGGTFQNRRVELTWTGVSKRNNKICALIQYQAFMNKFNTAVGTMAFNGRSHYWGDIWVSLEDKQIEHATLFEDVLVEFKLSEQANKQLIGVLRKATFEKSVESR
jgi:hypothetical protein